jgi:hypothetical protein
MYQGYTLQLHSDTSVKVYMKNSIYFVLAYDILEFDNRKGRGAKAEQSNHVYWAYKQRRIAKQASLVPPLMYKNCS